MKLKMVCTGWRSAQKGLCGKQACLLVSLGKALKWEAFILMWKIDGGAKQLPVVVAQSAETHANRVGPSARERVNFSIQDV